MPCRSIRRVPPTPSAPLVRLATALAGATTLALAASTARAQRPSPDTSRASAAATARDPHAVNPERPTVATNAGTVAPGWVEIEAGAQGGRPTRGVTQFQAPVVLKFGIASHAQLGVFTGAAYVRDASGTTSPRFTGGATDLAVGVKWRVLDGAPLVGDLALLPTIKLPTGSVNDGTGTGTTDAGLLLISSHALGPVSLDVNAGYTRRSGDGSIAPRSATFATISTGFPVRGRLGWVAELYGYPGTSGVAGQPPVVAFLTGPTLLVVPWLAVDAGATATLRGPAPNTVYAGAVWNVGRLPGRPR